MVDEEAPVPLPSAPRVQLSPTLVLQPPLTYQGHGPGLIIVVPEDLIGLHSESLDPPPIQKWAEEGYAVVQVICTVGSCVCKTNIQQSIDALVALPQCDDKDKFGMIVYSCDEVQIEQAAQHSEKIVAVVSYGKALDISPKSQVIHASEKQVILGTNKVPSFEYPSTKSSKFVIPGHADFDPSAAAVSHTRCLTFFKKQLGGPNFDLEAIWDKHTEYEFGERSVEKTMGTMVQEPYVNHVPVMTGGIGRDKLSYFYEHHFVFNNPADTKLELVSRTTGIDRVIDEFIFSFTHDMTMDWLLPGVPPTHKKARIPFMSVVNIRGDRLYHEHIWWDQATALKQLGLLPEYLPFPYPLPGGKTAAPGKAFEFRVPVGGVETAAKLVDESAVVSNGLFEYGIREVDAGS